MRQGIRISRVHHLQRGHTPYRVWPETIGVDDETRLFKYCRSSEGDNHTFAGARDHAGMRFSSVSRENKSTAAAWKVASTLTYDVFTLAAFFGCTTEVLGVDADTAEEGAGDAVRLGSLEPTMISLPCVSTSAGGNDANLASSSAGNFDLARSNTVLAEDDAAEVSDQEYYCRQ